MQKRTWLTGAVAALLSLTLVACGGAGSGSKDQSGSAPSAGSSPAAPAKLSGKVTAAGSTALLPLLKQAADDFMNQYPDVTVSVTGGGSGIGMNQVAQGAVDIGMSDVPLPADLQNKGLVDTQVCIAPFLIVTNPDVTVDSLTQDQLVGIFTGKITNWKEVGGKDEPIKLIHRAPSSGSRMTVQAILLKGQNFTDNATIQDSNGSVRQAIAQTPGAIGYVDAAYLDQTIKALKLGGVAYTPEAVKNKTYPLYAYEHLYTRGQPTGAVKAFIDYVMSADFQKVNVPKLGFIPLS